MDEYARYNKARWEELAAANVEYSRPMLNLDMTSARQVVDSYNIMGDVKGKDVLCLASGGGQQSAAFGLLGANVTVLDLSETQLQRDQIALEHYKLKANLLQGDMRDLSRFNEDAFDVVWQAFSINFVPDAGQVFDQVSRVLRPGGLYHLDFHNPFNINMDESEWTGKGYLLNHIYQDGEVHFTDNYWDVQDLDGTQRKIQGPREFNHTLSTIINGLIGRGFLLLGLWEEMKGSADALPGSWEHRLAVSPLALSIWTHYQPR